MGLDGHAALVRKLVVVYWWILVVGSVCTAARFACPKLFQAFVILRIKTCMGHFFALIAFNCGTVAPKDRKAHYSTRYNGELLYILIFLFLGGIG